MFPTVGGSQKARFLRQAHACCKHWVLFALRLCRSRLYLFYPKLLLGWVVSYLSNLEIIFRIIFNRNIQRLLRKFVLCLISSGSISFDFSTSLNSFELRFISRLFSIFDIRNSFKSLCGS